MMKIMTSKMCRNGKLTDKSEARMESLHFKVGKHELECKMTLDKYIGSDDFEIMLCLKSLPQWMKHINFKCKVYVIEKNVENFGSIHFNQNILKCL